jgi:Golgi phosphoprotein 3
MLTIFDKLFLFSLHEEKCTVLPSVTRRLEVGLCGAILAELAVQGKLLAIDAHKFELKDTDPLGNAILDAALELFKKSDQPHKVSYWLRRLVEGSIVSRKRMFERLVSMGVLSQEEEGYAWVVPYPDSPIPNSSARYADKSRLRELILTRSEPELNDLALLSVMQACQLLNLVFTKGERKAAKERVYAALLNKVMSDPVAQTLQEIQVALEVSSANA